MTAFLGRILRDPSDGPRDELGDGISVGRGRGWRLSSDGEKRRPKSPDLGRLCGVVSVVPGIVVMARPQSLEMIRPQNPSSWEISYGVTWN